MILIDSRSNSALKKSVLWL